MKFLNEVDGARMVKQDDYNRFLTSQQVEKLDNINWVRNDRQQDGYVPSPEGAADKMWATGPTGVPNWIDIPTGGGSGGPSPSWETVSTTAGWSGTLRVKELASGIVVVSGMLTPGTKEPGTAIATLPSNRRPPQNCLFAAATYSTGYSNTSSIYFEVGSNGVIKSLSESWTVRDNVFFSGMIFTN